MLTIERWNIKYKLENNILFKYLPKRVSQELTSTIIYNVYLANEKINGILQTMCIKNVPVLGTWF